MGAFPILVSPSAAQELPVGRSILVRWENVTSLCDRDTEYAFRLKVTVNAGLIPTVFDQWQLDDYLTDDPSLPTWFGVAGQQVESMKKNMQNQNLVVSPKNK